MKAEFLKRGPLLFLSAAIIVTTAHALIDADTDGMSDVWEEQHGFATSGTQPPHQLPTADPDGDGWTNLEESQAGTDPNSGVPPLGIIRPAVLQHPNFPTVFTISWPSLEGKQYTLQASPDLSAGSWIQIDAPMMGTGADIEFGTEALDEEGFIPDRLFWKVAVSDVDSDGDTLADFEELALNYNPYHTDSDLDGFPDNIDPQPLVSATLAEPDTTRPPTNSLTNLRGFWDFESYQGSSLPVTIPDRSGNNRHGSASTFPLNSGMPSKSGNIGPGHVTVSKSALQNQNTYTVSGWFYFPQDSIKSLADSGYRILYAVYDRGGTGPAPQYAPIGQGTVLMVRRVQNSEHWLLGGYKQTAIFNNQPVPGINGNPYTLLDIHDIMLPEGTTDDGKWHHFAVTRSATSNGQKFYLDGELIIQGALKEYSVSYDADTTITFGRLHPDHFQTTLPPGSSIDRIRIHSRLVNQADITALYQQDIDGDGLWDITECNTALWRDLNANLFRDANETTYTVSPYEWQSPDHDSDGDGATDLEEQAAGLNSGRADTDGDGIPDGWELSHGLDPKNPNDASLDNDVGGPDGLTNLQEYLWNTDPRKRDTDLDGFFDGPEISAGGNPNDASDGGSVPADQRFNVTLGIGDKSGSKSETYYLHCYRLDPTTGQEQRVYTLKPVVTPNSIYKSEVQSFFKKGETYTFQIDWQTTTNAGKTTSPTEGPDFDYTFEVSPQTGNGFLIDSWHPSGGVSSSFSILAANASNVATSEPSFRTNYENRRVVLLNFDIEEVISDQIGGNTANKLPTAYYGEQPNNPMLMGCRSGADAHLAIKAKVPPQFASTVRIGVRRREYPSIFASEPAKAPPGLTKLKFTAYEGSHVYQVMAGYDQNGNGVMEESEATLRFEKTPKTMPTGSPYSGGDPSFDYLDRIIVVTKNDSSGGRVAADNYGDGVLIDQYAPTAAAFLNAFAQGASTIAGASATTLGILLDATTIPSADGLSHPVGARWGAANTATTFEIELPSSSSLAGKIVDSSGFDSLIDRIITANKPALVAAATSSWATAPPISFIDKDVDFRASDNKEEVHIAIGKGVFHGTLEVSYRSAPGGNIEVGSINCYGYVRDLYDWAYGAEDIEIIVVGVVGSPRQCARAQAGYATLTGATYPEAGRVFFNKVNFGTGAIPLNKTY